MEKIEMLKRKIVEISSVLKLYKKGWKIRNHLHVKSAQKFFNRKDVVQRHISEVHHGKHRDVKKEDSENFIGFETVQDENKYIESVLNSVKTDFERKRELGEKAMEIIEKYELDVQKMPEEVKDAIRFNLKMVVKN